MFAPECTFLGIRLVGSGKNKRTDEKLPENQVPEFRWPLALTAWSQPVSRTGVSWLLLAGRAKGSSFPCSGLAFILQRVQKGNDGGPGVRPGHRENTWESLEQLSGEAEGTPNSVAWQLARPLRLATLLRGLQLARPGQGCHPAAAAELWPAQLSLRLRVAAPGGVGSGRAQPLRSSPPAGPESAWQSGCASFA